MPKLAIPELRAVEQVIHLLESFSPTEQKRIVMVACALMGKDWVSSFLPVFGYRREIAQAERAIALKKGA